MKPKDRIIVALDVTTADQAIDLVSKLKPHVGAFKIGLEFMQSMLMRLASYEYDLARQELEKCRTLFSLLDGRVFWDGKFMDIPNTVAGAARPVSANGLFMFNVHCLGGHTMMRAAAAMAKDMQKVSPNGNRSLVLGVTILTSLSEGDLVALGLLSASVDSGQSIGLRRSGTESVVGLLASYAKECGLDGVVCSPQEIKTVREYCGTEFLIVTPGIRFAEGDANDQRRIGTPASAIKAGADYLVIGRAITGEKSPEEAAKRVADEIESVV